MAGRAWRKPCHQVPPTRHGWLACWWQRAHSLANFPSLRPALLMTGSLPSYSTLIVLVIEAYILDASPSFSGQQFRENKRTRLTYVKPFHYVIHAMLIACSHSIPQIIVTESRVSDWLPSEVIVRNVTLVDHEHHPMSRACPIWGFLLKIVKWLICEFSKME